MSTKLLYMEDFDVVAGQATVTDLKTTGDGRTAIILDQTCFYPRGGGQDWDEGIIEKTEDRNQKFEVDEVRLDETGTVQHIGSGNLQIGDQVNCQADKARRSANTRLHSAGHLLDMAMSGIRPDLVPGKGAHYPHMSFVEYEGLVEDPEVLTRSLQAKIDEILAQEITNTLKFVSLDELKQLCRHVPDNLPTNKPIRVVLYGNFGVPCGGTHVRQLQHIGKIEITKLKSKKGITKINYRVEGIN